MTKILAKFKKEFLIMLGTVLLILGLSTYFMHNQNSQSLIIEQSNKLSTLKNALKVYVENHFKTTQHVLLSLSNNQTTISAFKQFNVAFNQENDNTNTLLNETFLNNKIQEFLDQISYDVPQSLTQQPLENYLPQTENSKLLQEYFIARSPHDRRQRHQLEASGSNHFYDKVHQNFHPYFRDERLKYSFYDIFLIDKSGNVVYSVSKEFDFASNLITGAFANSNLAAAFKNAVDAPRDSIIFEDFRPYEPSQNKSAAFIATPLYENDVPIGVLAIQLSIRQLVKVMTLDGTQEKIGLGESGESYLVGDDFYMRSDSRFIHSMTDPLVQKFSTTVGITKVKTTAVLQALKGITSDALTVDYRGVSVYSSFTPIQVFNKQWAMLVEVNEQEILDRVSENTLILTLTSAAVFLIFISMVLYLFVKMILRPMQNNEELITENLRLQNKALLISETVLNEYQKAVDLSAIVSKANKRGVITYVNKEFCKISGYAEEELIGKPHNIVRHPDMPKAFFKQLWSTLKKKQVWKGIIKNRRKDGTPYYVNSTIVPILDENKNIQEFMSIRTDVTDLVLKEEQLQRQTIDPITALPNRLKLLEDINGLKAESSLASIFISNFNEIYDFHGSTIANQFAEEITAIFKQLIHEKPLTLYRISHDGFALLPQKQFPVSDFEQISQSITAYFDNNILKYENFEINAIVSIGIASGRKNRLFFHSEMALRKAIESSRGIIVFESNSNTETQYQNNVVMTTKIKNAIQNDNILVYMQAISPNHKYGRQKFECLVRMRDGDEIISPFYFLEISKKAKLYPTITKIIIEKSFEYFSHNDSEFSINVTLDDIMNDEITDLLKHKIKTYGIGERLVFELVESEGIEEYEKVHEFIAVMKSLGCKIAIDDFGTGYSNFEYLTKLNVDYIKIDGSLIKNIHLDPCTESVVNLIVNFAKRMNIQVIAEFVHNAAIQKKINEIGIDYSQGYYISAPIALTEQQNKSATSVKTSNYCQV